MYHVIVVGAGQAGAALVAKLRVLGFAGRITLFGAEPVPPYQRPPLSKAYLLGQMPEERLYLRPASFYAEHEIALRLGTPVDAIDPGARTLSAGGETVRWDALVLATGALPRRLPAAIGGALPGVHEVRTLGDVDGMRPAFAPGRRALVVGGGYIGLEAAAVATKLGLRVTLVEAAPRILQRVAAPETSDYFRALHHAHGVEIMEGVALDRLVGTDRVAGALLAGGREIAADLVIVGIGIAPDTRLAEAAGLVVGDGVAVDALGQTSAPAIWAAGDCASFPYGGGWLRLESVGNAIDMAEAVAANILGAGAAYVPKPWFWSDQYDVKLQIAGLGTGYDRVVVRPGARPGSISHWYFGGNRLLAVDAMNDPRSYMIGKRLIEAEVSPDPAVLGDAGADLKALVA